MGLVICWGVIHLPWAVGREYSWGLKCYQGCLGGDTGGAELNQVSEVKLLQHPTPDEHPYSTPCHWAPTRAPSMWGRPSLAKLPRPPSSVGLLPPPDSHHSEPLLCLSTEALLPPSASLSCPLRQNPHRKHPCSPQHHPHLSQALHPRTAHSDPMQRPWDSPPSPLSTVEAVPLGAGAPVVPCSSPMGGLSWTPTRGLCRAAEGTEGHTLHTGFLGVAGACVFSPQT